MPLPRNIGRARTQLEAEGRRPRQALAIALRNAGVKRAPGRPVRTYDLYTRSGVHVGEVNTSLPYTKAQIEVSESMARGYAVIARLRRSKGR